MRTAPMPRPPVSTWMVNCPASGPYRGSFRNGADVSSRLISSKAACSRGSRSHARFTRSEPLSSAYSGAAASEK